MKIDRLFLESLGGALVIGGLLCALATALFYLESPTVWSYYIDYSDSLTGNSCFTEEHLWQFVILLGIPLVAVLAARIAGLGGRRISGVSGDLSALLAFSWQSVLILTCVAGWICHGCCGSLQRAPLTLIHAGALILVSQLASFLLLLSTSPKRHWLWGAVSGGVAAFVNGSFAILSAHVCFYMVVSWMRAELSGLSSFLPVMVLVAAAPLAGLSGTILCIHQIRSQAHNKLRFATVCLATIVVCFISLALPEVEAAILNNLVPQTVADDPAVSRAAIRVLRTIGNPDSLLEACYDRNDPLTLFRIIFCAQYSSHNESPRLTPGDAQLAYYRVYGKPFNEQPRPRTARGLWFDGDQGGNRVATKVEGVELIESSIHGVVDSRSAASDFEWTMVFKNKSSSSRGEARLQMQLPAGAVVSGAWLWIKGERRRAAVDGVAQTRAAYEQIVRMRRDPLLVSWKSPDRVLVQCYPIPPAGGTMKIAIQVSAPVDLISCRDGRLALPRVVESNFITRTRHQIDFTGDQPVSFAPGHQATPMHVEAALSDAELFCADSPALSCAVMPARITTLDPAAKKNVMVVVDGSVGMKGYLKEVATALASMPADAKARVIFASDEISSLVESKDATSLLADAVRLLPQAQCKGGADNLAALAQACKSLQNKQHSAVLWIHAPQPVLPERTARARYHLQTITDSSVPVIDFDVTPGPNAIVQDASGAQDGLRRSESWARLVHASRVGTIAFDLKRTIAEHIAGEKQLVAVSTATHAGRAIEGYRQVMETIGKDRESASALRIARECRLVTPITSAIVLESTNAYRAYGISTGGLAGDAACAAPVLQGATNGTIGPQGADATATVGVNTAGTVRVNNVEMFGLSGSARDANLFSGSEQAAAGDSGDGATSGSASAARSESLSLVVLLAIALSLCAGTMLQQAARKHRNTGDVDGEGSC